MRLGTITAVLFGVAATLPAAAQTDASAWPSKQTIRLVSPFPAGSSLDTIARPVFEEVGRRLGQGYIVENRPGAGGTIGMAAVAKAEPDGYTLLINSSVHTITPSTYSNLRYDTVRDFAGIAPLAQFPNVLVVPPQRYKTIAEMVEFGRGKPGALTYGSGGVGAATHLNAERLLLSAGVKAVHVPFKGAPEALREVIGDRIDFYFSPLASALPVIEGKEVRALAVSGLKRTPALPDVPTTLEAGFPNSDYTFWIGVFAPAATPRAIIDRLSAEIARAKTEPSVTQAFARQGAEAMSLTPVEYDQFVRAEIDSNAAVARAAGIKSN